MKHTLLIKDWLYSFLSLWFPRCCVVCGGSLAKGEECICTMCNINLPRTDYHLRKDNPVEKLFWGKFPLERATSFFFYRKGSDFRQVLHQLKYGGQKEIGAIMGRYMASELQASDFFHGVDVIIPIPLHKKKQQIRGYNQSEWISRGITAVTGIPVDTEAIIRRKLSLIHISFPMDWLRHFGNNHRVLLVLWKTRAPVSHTHLTFCATKAFPSSSLYSSASEISKRARFVSGPKAINTTE